MHAFVLSRYGGPEGANLTDWKAPTPGPEDVLVEVRAAGLNPVDFKTRQGMLRPVSSVKLPAVMGNELAGDVVGVGGAVRRFKVGDRVFARVGKDRMGAFAEQAVVNEAHCTLIPNDTDFVTAAAVPLAGLTALQALRDELNLRAGQRILISGGAGGVGTYAIQLAKWLGAHVTTTASPRGDALVRSLGADEVIDYTTSSIAGAGETFDAGFDLIGGDTLGEMFKVVKPGGMVVSVAGVPEPQTALKDLSKPMLAPVFWLISFGVRAQARRERVAYRYLFMHPSGEDLGLLGGLIEEGKLKVIVDRTFPFADMPHAIAYLEAGHAKGKVVVTMGG